MPRLRHNHVQGETNEDEFDHELFEPTHTVQDGKKAEINAAAGLHDEHLYAADDGIIQLHPQGTTTS